MPNVTALPMNATTTTTATLADVQRSTRPTSYRAARVANLDSEALAIVSARIGSRIAERQSNDANMTAQANALRATFAADFVRAVQRIADKAPNGEVQRMEVQTRKVTKATTGDAFVTVVQDGKRVQLRAQGPHMLARRAKELEACASDLQAVLDAIGA